ncbi:MAG: LOW QUALITY PROTEIN: hypothetical protein J3R72DRAFT_442366 [Linnemannia gamsii]|nr:MAG: LOW QUALITY PROTEIN: hypothetical protein J3R72DRAFT_442366 [Linnemannia gamsii]
MDDSMFFRTANVTRRKSKFHLVERVYVYRAVMESTAQELGRMYPRRSGRSLRSSRTSYFSAEELDVLAEVIGLLRPAADFTHWTGISDYTTISQVYEKVHNLIPPTEGAQQMHMHLKLLIDFAWPLDDISVGMLLAMYLNPDYAAEAEAAIAAALTALEAATKAAAKIAAKTGVGQDLAQDPQDDPSNTFQDQNPDPPSGFDHLPEQLPYKRMRPKPTNRLRAETLVYRAIIQRQVDPAIEKQRSGLAGSSFNSFNDANKETVVWLTQVNAESSILAYKAALGNTTRSIAFNSLCHLARMYLATQATDFSIRWG